jgi:hypothetical protein
MSFESALHPIHLPEKPWKLGAVVRLTACVIVCMMMGGIVAMVFRYFETPQTSSLIQFIAVAAGAFASYAAAVVLLCLPWPSEERYLMRLIWLLSCIYGGFFLTWVAAKYVPGKLELENPFITLLIAMFSFQAPAIVLIHFFLREHQTGWREGFGLHNRPALSLGVGICAGILITYPVLWLNGMSFHLFEKLALHPQEQHTVEILRHTPGGMARIVSGIATIIIAPVGEELLFRGILYPTVKRHYGRQIALWGTAILFGAIHLNLSSFIPLVLLAAILVGLYEYTGNLLAPIAVHCVFNATNFVELFRQQN